MLSTVATSHTSSIVSGLGHAPSATERAAALVSGYTTGFTVGGVLLAGGAALLLVALRRRDVASIATGDEPALAAA